MTIAKFVTIIHVADPETGLPVPVEIWKDMEANAMLGVESSFVDEPSPVVVSPYNSQTILELPPSQIPAETPGVSFELWRGLNVSSSHVTEQDAKYLPENPHVVAGEYKNGWWVRIPEELLSDEDREDMLTDIQEYGFSKDFVALLRFAVDKGCQVINIDGSAPYIPGLNRNKW